MLCEWCKKNESSVHITKNIDGQINNLNICQECALEAGIDFSDGLSISDILFDLGNDTKLSSDLEQLQHASERMCEVCHLKRSDFRKNGRLGCAACYKAFENELKALLKAMHRGDHHIGKIPTHVDSESIVLEKLAKMREALQKAITNENFEEAAALRDRIKAYSAKIKEKNNP